MQVFCFVKHNSPVVYSSSGARYHLVHLVVVLSYFRNTSHTMSSGCTMFINTNISTGKNTNSKIIQFHFTEIIHSKILCKNECK